MMQRGISGLKGKKNYLFNEFALAKVWRARMLESINQTIPAVLPPRCSLKMGRRLSVCWVWVTCSAISVALSLLWSLARQRHQICHRE